MDSGYSGSPRPGCSLLTGDASQPSLCFMIVGKTALVGAKSAGVIVAPAMRHARRVLYVQHLVVQDVLSEPLRYLRRVKRLADRNRFINSIVVTENAARTSL